MGGSDDGRKPPAEAVSSAQRDTRPQPIAPPAPPASARSAVAETPAAPASAVTASPPRSAAQRIYPAGTVLSGIYELGGLLGSGGMAQVYEARDLRLGRTVAIKISRPGVDGLALVAEARALAPFRHPGLVTVHALGEHEGTDYLVMERLSGNNLGEHLAQRALSSPFSVEETLDILLGIADALGALHNAGLVHRDLKAENVVLAPRGRVVLLDLGIVRQERHFTGDATVSGSPLYMAPESILGRVKTGDAHLVDVYALGVLAFEMLCGRPPYMAPQAQQLLIDHVKAPVPSPSSFRRDLPPALDRLVVEMLAKRPDERPSSIDVVSAMLRSIRGSLGRSGAVRPLDVLIVDDDAAVREIVERFVRAAAPDATVRFAADGRQALVAFHAAPPDVMFLDLQMPVMNGMEVCMYLRGTNIANRTTIVVISSYAGENQDLLAQLGVADVLAKKHHGPMELASKIRTLLHRIENARGRSPAVTTTR